MRAKNGEMQELRDQFPAMPEEIRQMVAREVERHTGQPERMGAGTRKRTGKKAGRGGRRTAILVAAAVALLGTTVIAGVRLGITFSTSQVGEYGVEISQKADEADWEAPVEVPKVEIQASYIPQGMVSYDDGLKIGWENSLWQGGISMNAVIMDEENKGSSMLLTSVAGSQEIEVGGRQGVFVELAGAQEEGSAFNRRIYLLYPEVWHVLEMYIAGDVTTEEALAVAEGISLVPTGETVSMEGAYTWSDVANPETEIETGVYAPKVTASRDELTVLKQGESGTITASAQNTEGEYIHAPLEVRVSSVQVGDNLSLLGDWENDPCLEDDWREAADETGALLPDEISYIKSGDGIDTLDQVIKTIQMNQKLVYAAVEYTNSREKELKNVLFGSCIMSLLEEGDTFTVFNRAASESGCDWTEQPGPAHMKEMDYYDVRGGDRGNNYISSIQPGETVTVHMAWIVNEDELDKLYLDVSGLGNGREFPSPERGTPWPACLVDIR